MAVTMEQVRAYLDADEVNYSEAARLGSAALPHLQRLAQSPDVMLASKATYLASVIHGDLTPQILAEAGSRPEPAIRVAAASGVQHLAEQHAEPLVERLLNDDDVGVRKMAVRSAAALSSPAMRSHLERVAEGDPEPAIRDLATRAIQR